MRPSVLRLVPMQVDEINDTDVVCTARTAAVLDGLLTVFHTERSPEGVSNVQNDLEVSLPPLSERRGSCSHT